METITQSPKKKKPRTILSFFSTKPSDKPNSSNSTESETSESPPSNVVITPKPAEVSPKPSPKSVVCSEQSATSSEKKKIERKFQESWLKDHRWLAYDSQENCMTCTLCTKHKKINAFTSKKNTNFKTTTLTRHATSKDHKDSVQDELLSTQYVKAVDKVLTDQESSVMVALRAAFWIAKNDLPLSKFGSLVEFLGEVDCPNVEHLKCRKSVSYSSDEIACELIKSLAAMIRKKLDNKLLKSPFVSLLLDESTDIAVTKKLVVYAWVIDTDTYTPSTHFITNMKVESGTGEGIYNEVKTVLNQQDRVIEMSRVMGLGTDGAKVMTGTGKGLTGYMLRDNPMLLNYHCIAHRLALVTSQAANQVSYLVEYQTILTGIFYFFKSSAVRSDKLKAIQELLEEPQLKVKEVHDVRWLSTYIAVQSVYRTLDSLLTFFGSDKDAKAKGFGKKMIQYDFIASTYLLMDVLPIVSELCLVFQKRDLDISQVKVQIDHAKQSLLKVKSGECEHDTYLGELQTSHLSVKNGKVVFKNNHIVQGRQNIDSIKKQFIDALLEKLEQRFPDESSNLMVAFTALGLRPLSFLSRKEREDWGNEKIEALISQYGEEKKSTPTEEQPEVTMKPVINPVETRAEWAKLKELVLHEGYPRDKMSTLWSLIYKYHKEAYPNLLTLAALAMTAPIHTADCERGFSSQNLIKTASRNRLSSDNVNNLMTVKLEGGDSQSFDFVEALSYWRASKQRKIFQ